MNAAILMTFYFVIGSRLEERKLLRYHGEIYHRYRERVPGLVPLPWKYLRDTDVKALAGNRE
jgi:protein-S-isoprenylcysteine O-methyltransferase Ste14